jgi:hypothetical protein
MADKNSRKRMEKRREISASASFSARQKKAISANKKKNPAKSDTGDY